MQFALAGFLILAALGWAAWLFATRPQFSAPEQGRRLAEQYGCFGCHGPDGMRGAFNPGRSDVTVPDWRGDLMMYAKDSVQIVEWIRDGVTTARATSQTWHEQRDRGALKMPAYGKRLSSRQIAELVTLVMLVNGQLKPEDSLAVVGYSRADSLGCFSCHGAGGWISRPNPGSLKGYVASWATADFSDLVHDRQEFDQWVTTGVSSRAEKNTLAMFFLRRSVLHMPAYRDHLRPGDLDALWAYVQWVQTRGKESRSF